MEVTSHDVLSGCRGCRPDHQFVDSYTRRFGYGIRNGPCDVIGLEVGFLID